MPQSPADQPETERAGPGLADDRYRRLVDVLAEGVMECAADGTVRVWNKAAERLFGVASEGLLGRRFAPESWELFGEDGLPLPAAELPLARTLRTGEPCSGVVVGVRAPHVDGVRWLSVNSRSLEPAAGGAAGAVASFADITDQKGLLDRLDRLKRQEQAILDTVPVYIWVKDRENRISRINRHAAQALGMAQDEVAGRSTYELYPQEADAYYRDDLQVIATGTPKLGILEPMDIASGERRWVTTSKLPLLSDGGEVAGVIVLSIDVTDHQRSAEQLRHDMSVQKAAEAERERLRERLSHSLVEWQQTFDSIGMPVFLVHPAGVVGRMNGAARALAGRGFTECLHRRLDQLGGGEPWATAARLATAVQSAGAGAGSGAGEQCSWEGRTWEIRVHPMQAGGGVIVTLHDQTDLVRLQESLRRSATMSAMGMLVAGVAHEVRNPLFGLGALLDTFESQSEPRQPFPVDPFRRGLSRLQNLMQQLLDYGQPAVLVRARHPLRKTLQEAVETCGSLARERSVEVALVGAADLPPVHVDESRMLQVFSNLVDNAIRYSPAGGRVTVQACAGAGWLDCTVEDEGPGVTVEDLASIFEPFFTRRRGGTGLGLAIVQKIVMEHGGRVICCGREDGGAGTRMIVRLPLDRP